MCKYIQNVYRSEYVFARNVTLIINKYLPDVIFAHNFVYFYCFWRAVFKEQNSESFDLGAHIRYLLDFKKMSCTHLATILTFRRDFCLLCWGCFIRYEKLFHFHINQPEFSSIQSILNYATSSCKVQIESTSKWVKQRISFLPNGQTICIESLSERSNLRITIRMNKLKKCHPNGHIIELHFEWTTNKISIWMEKSQDQYPKEQIIKSTPETTNHGINIRMNKSQNHHPNGPGTKSPFHPNGYVIRLSSEWTSHRITFRMDKP